MDKRPLRKDPPLSPYRRYEKKGHTISHNSAATPLPMLVKRETCARRGVELQLLMDTGTHHMTSHTHESLACSQLIDISEGEGVRVIERVRVRVRV
jgi:hypothetical protein